MPMLNCLNRPFSVVCRMLRREDGTTVIEFALVMPVLLLLAAVLIDLGRAWMQADALQKGLRPAVEYAARCDTPITAGCTTNVENLAKTGTLDGSGALLVPGWADAGALLNVTYSSFDPGSGDNQIIHMQAQVPYQPILSGLISWSGLDAPTLEASHEQAHVGT